MPGANCMKIVVNLTNIAFVAFRKGRMGMFYTLRSRMALTFSLIMIVPFVTMVLIFSEQSKKNVQDVLISSSAQTLNQYTTFMNLLGQQIEDVAFQVMGNSLTQEWIQYRHSGAYNRVEKYLMNAKLKEYLSSITLSQSNLVSITIFDENGFAVGNDSVYELVSYGDFGWVQRVKEQGATWLPSHLDPYQAQFLQTQPINSLLFPLVDLRTYEVRGVIKLNFLSSLIADPLNAIKIGESGSVRLIDRKGHSMIAAEEFFRLPDGVLDQINESPQPEGVIKTVENGRNVLVFYSKLGRQDWIVIGKISEKELFRSITATRRLMFGIGALLLFVTIVAAYWFSSGIARPLTRLSQAMRQVEQGSFSAAEQLEAPQRGEVGYVVRTFKRMVHTLNQLINEEYKANLRRKHAEYKALLMQINPHFLYNTLEVVSGLAAQKMNDKVVDVVEALGMMLRYSLKLGEETVPLRDDLRNLKHYAFIMETRFGDRLQIHFDEDPEAGKVHVLKFILQPIVENAVKYSVEHAKPAIVRIRTRKEGDRVMITVQDNGKGMDAATLEKIRRSVPSDEKMPEVIRSEGEKIGLTNVIARCRLHYGDRFGFDIRSSPGAGTSMTLMIPTDEGANDVQSADRG